MSCRVLLGLEPQLGQGRQAAHAPAERHEHAVLLHARDHAMRARARARLLRSPATGSGRHPIIPKKRYAQPVTGAVRHSKIHNPTTPDNFLSSQATRVAVGARPLAPVTMLCTALRTSQDVKGGSLSPTSAFFRLRVTRRSAASASSTRPCTRRGLIGMQNPAKP